MRSHATIRLSFPSKKRLNIALKALRPETMDSPTSRSRVKVEGKDKCLTLRFEAKDTTALRASVNSYLRWALLVNDVCSVMKFTSRNKRQREGLPYFLGG